MVDRPVHTVVPPHDLSIPKQFPELSGLQGPTVYGTTVYITPPGDNAWGKPKVILRCDGLFRGCDAHRKYPPGDELVGRLGFDKKLQGGEGRGGSSTAGVTAVVVAKESCCHTPSRWGGGGCDKSG